MLGFGLGVAFAFTFIVLGSGHKFFGTDLYVFFERVRLLMEDIVDGPVHIVVALMDG